MTGASTERPVWKLAQPRSLSRWRARFAKAILQEPLFFPTLDYLAMRVLEKEMQLYPETV